MAANALEEKINKIRQQNEEIRRRHEEVEEDKKNAAKLNALVQMVPSTDWPERKEPPEFSNPPRVNNKSKSAKEHHEYPQQYHVIGGEGRKIHTFAEGQGPPPDPKYNFLADSEREISNTNSNKDNPSKGQKYSREIYRRKSGGKDGNIQKNHKTNRVSHRDEYQPEYEAWRAERNRIDEDRISRQRTAEGNWRREWDNDKAHVANELSKHEAKLGDYAKKDYKDFDRKHLNGNDYINYNRGGNYRSYRGSSRHFHNYENRSKIPHHRNGHIKNPLSSDSEERTITATDQNIKITSNQGNIPKGPVMSVKVNSPSIAGTGRVGPRQRGRVTYSSHSDVEVTSFEIESCARPKSFEDKSKGTIYHDNLQKFSNVQKTSSQLKKNFNNGNKAYLRKTEISKENATDNSQKQEVLKEYKESQEFSQTSKLLKVEENNAISLQNEITAIYADPKETDVIVPDVKDVELGNMDKQNDYLNICIDISEKNEIYPKVENDSVSKNSDLFALQPDTEIEMCTVITTENISEPQIAEEVATSEHEVTEADLIISTEKTNNNTKNEMQSIVNQLCNVNDDTKDAVIENGEQNSTTETFKDTVNYNCDNTLCEDISEQENNVNTNTFINEDKANEVIIPPSTYIYSIENDNKLQSDNQALKSEEIVTDEISVIEKNINTDITQDVIICNNKIQERTSHDNIEEKNDEAAIGEIELPKENQTKEETLSNKIEKQ